MIYSLMGGSLSLRRIPMSLCVVEYRGETFMFLLLRHPLTCNGIGLWLTFVPNEMLPLERMSPPPPKVLGTIESTTWREVTRNQVRDRFLVILSSYICMNIVCNFDFSQSSKCANELVMNQLLFLL